MTSKVKIAITSVSSLIAKVRQYPDVISLVECIFERSPQTTSFIMDSEIVAMDPVDGSIRSFQELSNRARKDVKLSDIKVAVGVFGFDLMYLDGEVSFAMSESLPSFPYYCTVDPPGTTFQQKKRTTPISVPSVNS
jgi:hypothetical protein